MRTLKKPKLIFNLKYISKINLNNFKRNMAISNINRSLINVKKEFTSINNEITVLHNSLLKIKNSYGYLDFVVVKNQQSILGKQKAYEKIYNSSYTNNSNNEPATKALTIVKTRASFKYCTKYKKSCQVFVKIPCNFFDFIFSKLFYIEQKIAK